MKGGASTGPVVEEDVGEGGQLKRVKGKADVYKEKTLEKGKCFMSRYDGETTSGLVSSFFTRQGIGPSPLCTESGKHFRSIWVCDGNVYDENLCKRTTNTILVIEYHPKSPGLSVHILTERSFRIRLGTYV